MHHVQTEMQNIGSDHRSLAVGYACHKGSKPIPNQDDLCLLLSDRAVLLAVFDGHGVYGHYCSYTAQQLLPQYIFSHPSYKEDVLTALSESYKKTDEALNAAAEREGRFSVSSSGTTATTLLIRDGYLHIAHVGDSRAILVQSSPESPDVLNILPLTRDHSPSNPEEQLRIEKHKGEVRAHGQDPHPRVYSRGTNFPGLAMSRALGDEFAKMYGVIAEPEVTQRPLHPRDLFVVVCSDGVWEVMSESTAANLVHCHGRDHVQIAVDRIVEQAQQALKLQELEQYSKSIQMELVMKK